MSLFTSSKELMMHLVNPYPDDPEDFTKEITREVIRATNSLCEDIEPTSGRIYLLRIVFERAQEIVWEQEAYREELLQSGLTHDDIDELPSSIREYHWLKVETNAGGKWVWPDDIDLPYEYDNDAQEWGVPPK